MSRRVLATLCLTFSLVLTTPSSGSDLPALFQPIAYPAAENNSVYFLIFDRFANSLPDDSTSAGYRPTDPGYFHGGDIKGATERLNYIKELGFSSIWVNPPVLNRAIQGSSAGYHGYWGLDFTTIDPHIGTEADFAEFVDRAHGLGLKVILDIVVNHTADVITYREGGSAYTSLAASPYRDCSKKRFDSIKLAGKSAFPKLCVATSFPYTPKVSAALQNIKKPAFLNDLTNYHNRGNNDGQSEALNYGDFYGLDDLFTEKPSVIKGWIDLWGSWISRYKIDGFRIDTAQHVNSEFWKAFIPAMQKRAESVGIKNFRIFGEVYDIDPAYTSSYMRSSSFPSLLDFPLQSAVASFVTGKQSSSAIAKVFERDAMYTGVGSSAYSLMTFTGNHDMGRIASSILKVTNDPSQALSRAKLAQALLFTLRGAPISYYGDEVGIAGSGGDKEARQDMFATQVLSWQKQDRIGSTPIGTSDSFNLTHPLAMQVKELNSLRASIPALTRGSQRIVFADGPLLVIQRSSGNQKVLIAFNNSLSEQRVLLIDIASAQKLSGDGKVQDNSLVIPALSYVILSLPERAAERLTSISLRKPIPDNDLFGAFYLVANTNTTDNVSVTFLYRYPGASWRSLGTTDSPNRTNGALPLDSYAAFIAPRSIPAGKSIEVIAVAEGASGERVLTPITRMAINY